MGSLDATVVVKHDADGRAGLVVISRAGRLMVGRCAST